MLFHSSKILSFPPLVPPTKPKALNPRPRRICCADQTLHDVSPLIPSDSKHLVERGIQFEVGDSFFRHESFTGRDLGVLAAGLYKLSKPQLRVLDVMCGCGIRSLRYMAEAKADFVLANDANDEYRRIILSNLSRFPRFSGGNRRWAVTHSDANRVMTESYLQRDFFDFIDVDSFGSESSFLRSAFNAAKLDGLVYVTSTDGFSSGGHRPHNSLASYGAYIRPMPYSNEVGLRMVIGGAIREASIMGYSVTPLFSYYSYHGPVFRVMLRLNRGKLTDTRRYGFISYCLKCGNSQTHSWHELGMIGCPCCSDELSPSLVVSGPLWTGPLHDAAYLKEMRTLAEKWEWIGNGFGLDLAKLLNHMIDESDPALASGYIKLDETHSWHELGMIGCPCCSDELSPSLVVSGPLWTGPLHDAAYLKEMRTLAEKWEWIGNGFGLDLAKLLNHMIDESDPALASGYIKLDEVASRGKMNTPPLRTMISALQKQGYAASRSHIAPDAFKTNCPMTACISIAKELQGH